MPTAPLPLEGDQRVTAWRALVDVIQADPDVRGLSIVWRLPDDTDFDNDPPRENICVRVVPSYGEMTPIANIGWGKRLWETTIALGFEITVPGSEFDNSANVWSTIERAALGHGLPTDKYLLMHQRLGDAGLFDVDSMMPAVTTEDSQTAVGSLILVCHIER